MSIYDENVIVQGFMAFCFKNVKLVPIDLGHIRTCSGNTCDGLYGSGPCPCVSTSTMPKSALALDFIILDDGDTNITATLSINLQSYTSTTMTNYLVEINTLEVK